jgi:hypothetical protein
LINAGMVGEGSVLFADNAQEEVVGSKILWHWAEVVTLCAEGKVISAVRYKTKREVLLQVLDSCLSRHKAGVIVDVSIELISNAWNSVVADRAESRDNASRSARISHRSTGDGVQNVIIVNVVIVGY